jgi:TonB family protein
VISPKSKVGSLVYSIGVHSVIAVSATLLLHRSVVTVVEKTETFVDLGYQAFEEPPPLVTQTKRVVQAVEPEKIPSAKTLPDNQPRELQDEKGVVTGTQETVAKQTMVGADSQGEAVSTPYYKITPKYPKSALVSGTEGWVLMKIDITETGDVQNVRSIGGEQRNLFQGEAERAVGKWKYKPFIGADGRPLKKADYQVRVDFKLTDIE